MEQSCREPEKARQKLKLRAGNVEAQRGRGRRKSSFYYTRKKKTKRQSCGKDTQLKQKKNGGMMNDGGFAFVSGSNMSRKNTETGWRGREKEERPETWCSEIQKHRRVRWRTSLTLIRILDFVSKFKGNVCRINSSHYYTSILILRHISRDE